MVLQRNIKVPVYGKADVGEIVQVNFMGKTFKTTTGADGKWLIKLNSYKAGGPYQMIIKSDKSNITLTNILNWRSLAGFRSIEHGVWYPD